MSSPVLDAYAFLCEAADRVRTARAMETACPWTYESTEPPAAGADRVECGLARGLRRRLPRALPVLLSRRVADWAPVTRVYANLDDILGNLAGYLGTGTVTGRRTERAAEGTTFEASCYSDPLALEHLTGSWQRAVEYFGSWEAPVQLRWTTKFGDVEPYLPASR